ncbi:hypothetical protein ACP0HM_12810 [Escherichia coli]
MLCMEAESYVNVLTLNITITFKSSIFFVVIITVYQRNHHNPFKMNLIIILVWHSMKH